jgi:ketosteroid isomerase-like protein
VASRILLSVLLAPALAVQVALPARAQPNATAAQASPVQSAATDFIAAFNTLDETRFDAFWADDATLFFPASVPGTGGARLDGKTAITGLFHAFFASIRRNRPGPNYLNIRPQDVHVQDYGDTAIVTFHLRDDDAIARRTLVMRRQAGRWLIAHMHASRIATPVPPVAPTTPASPTPN